MCSRATLFVAATLIALAACSSGDDAATTATSAVETPPDDSTSVEDSEPAAGLEDQYGVRYCEVLAVMIGEEGVTTEVWGSQGLNECPQAAFGSLDPATAAERLRATTAILNGPRYWVLDDVVAHEVAGSGEIRDLGDIRMRSIATVDLDPDSRDRTPYTEISVARDTEFIFNSDREVHELSAPDGSVYVMQSYSTELDPDLGLDNLSELGERLELPDGWSFASRKLDEQLVVEDIGGVATVIQDELRNTYQLRSGG